MDLTTTPMIMEVSTTAAATAVLPTPLPAASPAPILPASKVQFGSVLHCGLVPIGLCVHELYL